MSVLKKIVHRIRETSAHWVGDGFNVVPVFNELAFTEHLSPFLMFDYGFPKKFEPTTKKHGVGFHPHRGFETVTIAFQGEIEHRDSRGGGGTINAGDVQWMTAGSGLFHDEFHSKKFAKEGGVLEMCQLWVNLPAKLKMTKPKYQAIKAKDVPQVELPDDAGHVRVIAGNYGDAKGAAETEFDDKRERGSIEMWDVMLKAGGTVDLQVKKGDTTIVFVRRGQVEIDGVTLKKAQVVLLDREGTAVRVKVSKTEDSQMLFLGGAPILDKNGKVEPIASGGPMVMNTRQELMEAMMWAQKEQHKVQSKFKD